MASSNATGELNRNHTMWKNMFWEKSFYITMGTQNSQKATWKKWFLKTNNLQKGFLASICTEKVYPVKTSDTVDKTHNEPFLCTNITIPWLEILHFCTGSNEHHGSHCWEEDGSFHVVIILSIVCCWCFVCCFHVVRLCRCFPFCCCCSFCCLLSVVFCYWLLILVVFCRSFLFFICCCLKWYCL